MGNYWKYASALEKRLWKLLRELGTELDFEVVGCFHLDEDGTDTLHVRILPATTKFDTQKMADGLSLLFCKPVIVYGYHSETEVKSRELSCTS